MTLSAAACLLTLAAGTAHAQAARAGAVITGRVTTEDGTPLPGANVYITEMSLSVGTGPSGVYTINVPAARVSGQTVQLRVRSVGFAPQARPITVTAGTQTVNFQVRRDALRLSEVVVTGVSEATEQVRTPFTVQRVDTTQMPVVGANMVSQLQGKVPGANIVSASGRPGAAPVIMMRGPTSINASGRGQGPLFIVDGVMLQGSFSDINPNDIESIEIVKGAAAANLYGARAGSGVINVTTKSGKNAADGIKFGVRAEFGMGDIPRKFSLAQRHILGMDPTAQYFCRDVSTNGSPCTGLIDMDVEARRVNDVAQPDALPPLVFRNDAGIARTPGYGQLTGQFQVGRYNETRDPIAQMITPNGFANSNLDVRGRVGSTGVYGSVSNLTQQGAITAVGGFVRNSVRANIDQRFGDRVNVALQSFYSTQRDAGANQDAGGAGGNGFFALTRTPAFVDLGRRDSQGRLYIRSNVLNQGSQNSNPLYSFENFQQVGKGQRFLGGATVKYDPFDWATLEANFSYDRNAGDFNLLADRGFRSTTFSAATAAGSLSLGSGDDQSMNTGLTATLRRQFGDLRTAVSGRYLFEQQYSTGLSAAGNNLVVPGLRTLGSVVDQDTKGIGSSEALVRGIAYMASAQLDYKERYLLQANIRRDGSSLFGRENRWTNLPGVSASWIVSREGWWMGGDALSLLKLRAAYGQTAQRPSFVAQYATFTIGAGGTLNPAQLGNPRLRPEIRSEIEYGVETEFFNRIGFSATYAVNDIRDQILPVPLSYSTGFTSQFTNAGTLQNKSLELSLDAPIISRPAFSWSARLIFDRLRSTVTKLDVAPYFTGTGLQATETIFRIAEGERLGTIYGRDFVTKCSQLPAPFSGDCGGASSAFRPNDQGYIVWVGQGNQLTEGVTKNLWRARLAGANAPWGNFPVNATAAINWGMPILLRDSTGQPASVPLGQTLPKFRWGLSQNLRWKNLTAYGLVDASIGGKVWNQGYHWSLGDYMTSTIDMTGKTVETAKPIGYFWRAGPGVGGNSAGTGGFYDILGPNRHTVEDASYAKLREVSLSYRLGRLPGLNRGDWTFGVVGRNLAMWTKGYRGFDPEVGIPGGTLNNAALNGVDRYGFPNLRTVTAQISTAF